MSLMERGVDVAKKRRGGKISKIGILKKNWWTVPWFPARANLIVLTQTKALARSTNPDI